MGRRGPFSAAERAAALDLSVQPKQAAQQLGRTEGAIRSMRAKERLQRRLVPDGKHGTQCAARTYGRRCELCLDAARAHERAWEAQREQRGEIWRARGAVVAEITGAKAIRSGEPVTDEDIEIACDMSLTAIEAALTLCRTATAVDEIRFRYRDRHDPAQQPRSRPWTEDELDIALGASISLGEAVARLGRSPHAIAAKRATATRPWATPSPTCTR